MNGNGWRFLVAAVRDVGFPIFVAIYLLMQITPAIQSFARSQQVLIDRLDRLIQVVETPPYPPGPYPPIRRP